MTVWATWFEGKTFSTDWSSRAFSTWVEHLSHLTDKPLRILEIGSWEGRSTLFFLNFFPHSIITCVDLFTLGNERAFDANTAEFWKRITKVPANSGTALSSMRQKFDLIYVDGSHNRDDVMVDTLLSWRLLTVGGTMIWDDYQIHLHMKELALPDQWPQPAIDTFMQWHASEMEIIHSGYQVIVRKTKRHFL